MFTNFSDFNFEVIDVLVNNITPELTINKNTVTLSWKLLEELGNPQFLRPLVDFKIKLLHCVCAKSQIQKYSGLEMLKKKTINHELFLMLLFVRL